MNTFEVQLVITEKCNLACTYCYMNKRPLDMTIEIFEAHYKMLPKILEDYQKDSYNLVFFGGEPLVNLDLVKYIIERVKDDKKLNNKMLITNGLLLNETTHQFLNNNGVGLSISFDGLGNDQCRPLTNGESSLEYYEKDGTYLKNFLRNCSGSKVMIAPSRNFTLLENYKWFTDRNMNAPDFSIVRDSSWDEESIKKFEKEAKELTAVIIDNIKNGKNTIVGFYRLAILDLLFGESYGKRPFGCFAGVGGAGFMPDGKVYPCARFGSNKKMPLYDSVTGMSFNSNIQVMYVRSKTHNYKKCQSCELYKYCNAGCSYSQMENNDEPLDCVCKLYFVIYKEAMRIVEELKNNPLLKDMIVTSIKNTG